MEEVGGLRIPGKWHVLYGSASVEIPSKKEIASFRERFGIEEKRFYLLALGLTSLQVKTRGAKLLIDALRHLPLHVEPILTGKGRFYSMLKEYAMVQGVDDRVIFPGYLKNPHIATMVADIYTHISYGEGLPLALLEVMSLGKAIIASRVMGIPESLRSPKEGILIENNVDNVVSNVTVLIENPKLKKKMAVLSRRAFLSRFSSWKMTALRLLSF
ncbi:glycosyltransferase family 4 protein [Thermococcus sp.]